MGCGESPMNPSRLGAVVGTYGAKDDASVRFRPVLVEQEEMTAIVSQQDSPPDLHRAY